MKQVGYQRFFGNESEFVRQLTARLRSRKEKKERKKRLSDRPKWLKKELLARAQLKRDRKAEKLLLAASHGGIAVLATKRRKRK